MRNACAVVLLLLLAGCSRGNRTSDREAIRQGVIDHLAGTNVNVAAMDVDVTSVQFNGAKADVMVTFRAKGAAGAPGMEMRYQMQEQGTLILRFASPPRIQDKSRMRERARTDLCGGRSSAVGALFRPC